MIDVSTTMFRPLCSDGFPGGKGKFKIGSVQNTKTFFGLYLVHRAKNERNVIKCSI
jgi:hypothetical protein